MLSTRAETRRGGNTSRGGLFPPAPPLGPDAQQVLCALMNSLVANWYVRHWVSTHVTTTLVARLPMPWLPERDPAFASLRDLSRRCASEGEDSEAWIALQAETARLYGLTAGELADVLGTFPLIEKTRLEAVARAFAGQ